MNLYAPGTKAVILYERWFARRVDAYRHGKNLLSIDYISEFVQGCSSRPLTKLEGEMVVSDLYKTTRGIPTIGYKNIPQLPCAVKCDSVQAFTD